MLELIAMAAGLAVCVWLPIEMSKIRKGWVHKKFAGDRPKFLAAYRKQLKALMWLGLVFGVLGLGLAAVEANRGEAIVRVVGAAIYGPGTNIPAAASEILSILRQRGQKRAA